MELIPGDSPESPLYPGNLTQANRIQWFHQHHQCQGSIFGMMGLSKSPVSVLSQLNDAVQNKPARVSAETFSVKQGGFGGFIIDSGALITALDQNANNGINANNRVVILAFQKYYDSLKLEGLDIVREGFELCYKPPKDVEQLTTMTYHFYESADYVVEWKFVHVFDDEQGYFYVALVPGNHGISISEAWHHQNKRLICNGNLPEGGTIGALQFDTVNCNS
ncbi:hypothetical protein FEM48_Zijuj01G0225700 [Ziziphus jujuba var. spinosa]|uniref:Uncharacterized protein n=1 Tax=Ziziphus jujuba var. spinosa TaxID=714518 RepID=A0A978W3Y1_ZIZJJ|nr:hypothetical protein FEM48_Zijuj01G0225700 [Ziziphus jujuba var. spinosa]